MSDSAPTSQYFGVVYLDADPKEIRMVINPDFDYQLDDPQWTTPQAEGEMLAMLRIAKFDVDLASADAISSGQAFDIVEYAKTLLGIAQ